MIFGNFVKHYNSNNIKDNNFNSNYFTIDLAYNWQFAPGSFLTAAWKNDIAQFDQLSNQDYFQNVDKTYHSPKANNLSVKLIYYLDYLSLRKHG